MKASDVLENVAFLTSVCVSESLCVCVKDRESVSVLVSMTE